MTPNYLIISEDVVFASIIHRLLLNNHEKLNIKKCTSFSSLKLLEQDSNVNVIILDDSIIGAANYEVITYLRHIKNITTPVMYFSNMAMDMEAARQKGANSFFKKPFVPSQVINEINTLLKPIIPNSQC